MRSGDAGTGEKAFWYKGFVKEVDGAVSWSRRTRRTSKRVETSSEPICKLGRQHTRRIAAVASPPPAALQQRPRHPEAAAPTTVVFRRLSLPCALAEAQLRREAACQASRSMSSAQETRRACTARSASSRRGRAVTRCDVLLHVAQLALAQAEELAVADFTSR